MSTSGFHFLCNPTDICSPTHKHIHYNTRIHGDLSYRSEQQLLVLCSTVWHFRRSFTNCSIDLSRWPSSHAVHSWLPEFVMPGTNGRRELIPASYSLTSTYPCWYMNTHPHTYIHIYTSYTQRDRILIANITFLE